MKDSFSAPERIAMALGTVSLVLIVGALIFEYGWGFKPCELCMWERWPHYAAILVGLVGGALVGRAVLPAKLAGPLAALTLGLVAASGAISVYHAGVEWHFWAGPAACTGNAFHYSGGPLNFNDHGPLCDVAAWRLFGISLAGYNALISLAAAGVAGWALSRSHQRGH
ncbi:MAG: disulfide bond formation protein B [Alphaproteobacteria bacterium]|nr:disulfide bond formation protein B [Alphaproteobacteria bacterium]